MNDTVHKYQFQFWVHVSPLSKVISSCQIWTAISFQQQHCCQLLCNLTQFCYSVYKEEELGCLVDITVVGQSLVQYLLCFSNEDPDFAIMWLIYLLGFTWRGAHSQILNFSQGISANTMINSPSENDFMYFAILWKMTNMALTAPSLWNLLLSQQCPFLCCISQVVVFLNSNKYFLYMFC